MYDNDAAYFFVNAVERAWRVGRHYFDYPCKGWALDVAERMGLEVVLAERPADEPEQVATPQPPKGGADTNNGTIIEPGDLEPINLTEQQEPEAPKPDNPKPRTTKK